MLEQLSGTKAFDQLTHELMEQHQLKFQKAMQFLVAQGIQLAQLFEGKSLDAFTSQFRNYVNNEWRLESHRDDILHKLLGDPLPDHGMCMVPGSIMSSNLVWLVSSCCLGERC